MELAPTHLANSVLQESPELKDASLSGSKSASSQGVPPCERALLNYLPMSVYQERLYFFEQLQPGSPVHIASVAVAVSGELQLALLAKAFEILIARHEVLRTVFAVQGDRAQQIVRDEFTARQQFSLLRTDLQQVVSTAAQDQQWKRIYAVERATGFDLARGPLCRCHIISLAEREHILIITMHHIISDGLSVAILLNELSLTMNALAQERLPAFSHLPVQYVDYSVWQRSHLQDGGSLHGHLPYWEQKLAGAPESLDLPTDFPRPNVQSFAGAAHSFFLDDETTAKFRGLAQRRGGTLFTVLLAAFKVLLYRYSGQNDICVGTTVVNRPYEEIQSVVGPFANMLALRSQLDGEDSFAGFLSRLKATCLEAFAHGDVPFEAVVERLQPQRSLAISPIFQVMFAFESGEWESSLPRYPVGTDVSRFDLTLSIREDLGGLACEWNYSRALYRPATIERMAEHLGTLCRSIAAKPTCRIQDLDLLGEAETHTLLNVFNATETEYSREICIHEQFRQRVALQPDRVAAVYEGQALSYQQLYAKSYELALYLQSQGVGPDSVVGLCVERSLDMLIGILGITLAGGAYLPADPSLPDDRLAYMLQDSEAAVVLTQDKFLNRVKYLLIEKAKLIVLDRQWPQIQKHAVASRSCGVLLNEQVQSHHACYVIYTSGSTGRPKGVVIEHRALVNRIHWMQKRYQLNMEDVVLQKTPFGFDVSVWEIFWPLTAGARLIFAIPEGHKDPIYLQGLIADANITTLHFVPSMLQMFLETAQGGCPGVKRVFSSGEALDKKVVDRYQTQFPNAALYNLYGPTEAAIDVTAYDCSRSAFPFVPIGKPIDNTQIYILDPRLHPQPIGVPGELHISGDGLARCYLQRPELTQEKFIANPFRSGARMYKTGDLARWMEDGNIQYLGRTDTQVKIRGFRMELEEIESQLNGHPEVRESAVVGQGKEAGKRIIAFYRARGSEGDQVVEIPQEELRAHLLMTLPDYMVPAAFVSLRAIPLTSSGKVDRRALSRMEVAIASDREYVAPRTTTERRLVEIWAKVLDLPGEKIGVHDHFFALGGHSLSAVRLIGLMRERGLHATLQDLFLAPELEKFAVSVDACLAKNGAEDPALLLEEEARLDGSIVASTHGALGEIRNAFLTGATGFLGAFLLFELLIQTEATVYCLVRAESIAAGQEKIAQRMRSFGLWDPSLSERIVAVVGDLTLPSLGLSASRFGELAQTIDAVYHCGAAINFYYPYSWHKAANVQGTQELLRLASFGRSKSFQFVSTLSVILAGERNGASSPICDGDELPAARYVSGGYTQSKWVGEKLMHIAQARGIPVVTYRPGGIIGHSETGVSKREDFISALVLGCLQIGCVPEANFDGQFYNEFYLVPVDYVSRSVVAISKRRDLFGQTFNLTNPESVHGRELLEALISFEPRLETAPYQQWRARLVGNGKNALYRFLEFFPEKLPEVAEGSAPPRFDCSQTLEIVKADGVEPPRISRQSLHAFFSYIAEVGRLRV